MKRTRPSLVVAAVCAAALTLAPVAASAGPPPSGGHAHGHDDAAAAPVGVQAEPLDPLASDCTASDLPPHDGFQSADAVCVATSFGEQSAQADNPSLLIVDAPDKVRVGQPFEIRVSTRNLVRDRFLPAGQGGYYLEAAVLNEDGLTRGHFHTACRAIGEGDEALVPERNAIFVATEDGGGGAAPDTVTVRLPGLPERGTFQCAAWAGDGSHRTPMMAFANQIPAFDAVRVEARGRG